MICAYLMALDSGESTRTVEWLAWFEVNKKKLLVVVLILAAAGAAFALYRAKANANEVAGWSALFSVERPIRQGGDSTGEPSPQAYLQVASAHQGTEAGAQSRLLAAQALFEQGKYPEARAQFEAFSRDATDSEFLGAAALGVAACLDSENKPEEARIAYLSVARQYAKTSMEYQAKLALARLHESRKEFADALRLYDELVRPTAQSVWSSDAGMRRETLLLAHPELVTTNQLAEASVATPLSVKTNGGPALSTNRAITPPAKP